MLTVREVALIFKRSAYTVRGWCRDGKIEAVRNPGGRGYLIPESAVAERPDETETAAERAARVAANLEAIRNL